MTPIEKRPNSTVAPPPLPSPAISTPSLRDFSKEINALLVAAMAAAPKPVAPVPTFIEPVSPTVFKSESESFLPGHQQIPPSVSVEFLPGVSVSSEESIDVLVVEEPRRWHTDRPDSGLLGKSPVRPDQVTSASPKKALTLGLAASVLLLLGTGTFYLRQNRAATTTPATAGALNAPSSPASLQPAKNSTRTRSQAVSATLATSQPPSAPIAERLSASAVVEPSAPPAPVGPAPAPAVTLDPQPAANPPAAELQPSVSASGFATAGASDAAPEPAPADVPTSTMEVPGETPQPRPGVQLGEFERPLAELAAFDPDRHRVSLGEHEGQAFQQGQHPGCTKNVTLGSVGKEKLYLGIPEWASRWLEKNSKKLPGICFSDSPMSGAQNFLIVFDTSEARVQTELLSTSSSSAAAWPEGRGAFTTSYGSTWHYNHNETVGTTVTSLLDDCPHSHPAHVSHAMAYTEEGMPISQRRSPTETRKSKESSVKPTSAKPGKTQDESTGAYRELDALLYLVVTDIEKW